MYVVAKLGVPDRLAHDAMYASDLATATGTSAPHLLRVLRLLAAAGILVEVEPNRFALAPMGELLQSHVKGSLRAFAVMTMELELPAWSQLLHCVVTGQPGFPQACGIPEWEYLKQQPTAAAVFDAAMVGLTRWQANVLGDGVRLLPMPTRCRRRRWPWNTAERHPCGESRCSRRAI